MANMYPSAFTNQQHQWFGPVSQSASPRLDSASRNLQPWTVNNSCRFGTFNSALQSSNNPALANIFQPYQRRNNVPASAISHQVLPSSPEASWMNNMSRPQLSLPNNVFSQRINPCIPSTSKMDDRRGYGNTYNDWSQPSHCNNFPSLVHKQATFNQPLVPVIAKTKHHHQIQDANLQNMPQAFYGLNAKMADHQSGKNDRNAFKSLVSGALLFCNRPQDQQTLHQCRISAQSNTPHESNASYSKFQSMWLYSGSQPPNYHSEHNLVKQFESQVEMMRSHSNKPNMNAAVPGRCFQYSSNSSPLHQEKHSFQSNKNRTPSQSSNKDLVVPAGSNKETELWGKLGLLKRLLKQGTHYEIPPLTPLQMTENRGRNNLIKPPTCVEENQASSSHLGTKAVAVVPPLSQESSTNISNQPSPRTTSDSYKDHKNILFEPNANVDGLRLEDHDSNNISGSSPTDMSTTQQFNDCSTLESTLKNATQVSELNQSKQVLTQKVVAPKLPVGPNFEDLQSSSPTESEPTPVSLSLEHNPVLLKTRSNQTSCKLEEQENPNGLLILKKDEEYSETPFKSAWLNVNEQLDDIDKEFGFPWTLRKQRYSETDAQTHQRRTNESSTGANTESPKPVSQTQLDPNESFENIDSSLTELLLSQTDDLLQSDSDESSYNFRIEVLPSVIAKRLYEQTCNGETSEPEVCDDSGAVPTVLKLLHEDIINRATALNMDSPLSEGLTTVLDSPSVEAEKLAKGVEETTDDAMRSVFSDWDLTIDSSVEIIGDSEDEDFSNTKELSSTLSAESDCVIIDSEEECAKPSQLKSQTKQENTLQGVKPLHSFLKKFFFQRNHKLRLKKKKVHSNTNNINGQHYPFLLQQKNEDTLKQKTSVADTPSVTDVIVIQEEERDNGRMEVIHTVEEDPFTREQNCCTRMIEIPHTPDLDPEEECAGCLDPEEECAGCLDPEEECAGCLDPEEECAGCLDPEEECAGCLDPEKECAGSLDPEKECAGSLELNGVQTQIQSGMINLKSETKDYQHALLNCKDGVESSGDFQDKVNSLSSQSERQNIDQQYKQSEDLDSRKVSDSYPSIVKVVDFPLFGSSKQEEMDDILWEIIKVTEGLESSNSKENNVNTTSDLQILVLNPEEERAGSLQLDVASQCSSLKEEMDDIQWKNNILADVSKSSNKEENSVDVMADPQILVLNPEEESAGSLQVDISDTQTKSPKTLQDSDNKVYQQADQTVLVKEAPPSNILGKCSIIDGKKKRQRDEEKSFHSPKKKGPQAEDLQVQNTSGNDLKCERLTSAPLSSSRFVKLSLYGKSPKQEVHVNQGSLRLPEDVIIHLNPTVQKLREPVYTEKCSVKEQVWEKWKESFVPTKVGCKGKPRNPVKFSSRENLKMSMSRNQKHCLSVKKRIFQKCEENKTKSYSVSSKLSLDRNRSDTKRRRHKKKKTRSCDEDAL